MSETRSSCRDAENRSSGRTALIKSSLIALTWVLGGLNGARGDELRGKQPLPRTASDLFQNTKLWTLHLHFTPDQWAAIEPEMRRGDRFGGMPPGPSMFLAPVMTKEGDRDGDGMLSRPEFHDLGEQWFTRWDGASEGKLGSKQVRDGLNTVLGPPPGAEAPSPRMNLQGPKGKRNGVSAMVGIDFSYVHATLDFEGLTLPNVAVRYKGNGTFMESRGSLKRSFKVDINKYVKGQQLAGSSTLNLHSNVTDASLMNEALAYRLYRDAGVPAPRVGYAKVFVTVPGLHDRRYFGIYSLVENIDKNFIQDSLQARGGALFKPVSPALFTDLGDQWDDYRQTYDPKTDLTTAQERRVMEFCKLVSRSSDADFAARLGDFVDLDELARYMAVTTWLSDMDGLLGPGQNFYVFLHPVTNKLLFMPWDQDHSFGQFPMRGTQEEREQLSIQQPWEGSNRFLERVYRVEAFQTRYMARFKEFSAGLFRPERFGPQIVETAAAIRPAVQEESSEKLARFDKAVAGEPLSIGFGPPPAPAAERGKPSTTTGPTFPRMEVIPIRPFAEKRSLSVAAQVAGESSGRTIGSTPPPPGQSRGDFSPGGFLAGLFLRELDGNRDGSISHEEFTQGFSTWFTSWDVDKTARLTDAQLRSGIDKNLAFVPGGPPSASRDRQDGQKP